MNRVVAEPVKIGEHKTRYAVKVFDDPSTDPKQRLLKFLQEFLDNPTLLTAGHSLLQKFAFYHNGECWVMTGEVEEID